MARNLPTLLGTRAKEVTFSLEREESGWDADLDTTERATTPPHARALPSARVDARGASYQQVLSAARGLQRLMKVPRAGSARLEVRLTLEDNRLSNWELASQDTSGSGPDVPASEAAITLLTHSIRPFMRGLGERTVVLTLEGLHREGERRPRWRLVEARTLEPAPPPKGLADVSAEYLALRERILLESQEGMREGAVYLAGFSVEQVATLLIGGFVLKRVLVLFEAVAPTVTSFIARGGQGAVRWLRNLLVRMPTQERQALQQLWLKAETQGIKALSEAEKTQLKSLMVRLERLLETPLKGTTAKDRLREWARTEYFELHRPELAQALGKSGMSSYEVHHLCPLEYAHLFPRLDINGKANLVGVYKAVHWSISRVWRAVGPGSERMRPEDVHRVMKIVDKHYAGWFHRVYDPGSASALVKAEQAALAEVRALHIP
ncbi:MAG TPA: hypothetical protein VF815_05120 [Myxococcaceae bacterium]